MGKLLKIINIHLQCNSANFKCIVGANKECVFTTTSCHVCVFEQAYQQIQTFQVQLSLVHFRLKCFQIGDSTITHYRFNYYLFQIEKSIITDSIITYYTLIITHYRFNCQMYQSFPVHLSLISGSSLDHFIFIPISFPVELVLE